MLVSLMTVLKPPFKSTSVIYDTINGIKPFIVPVFNGGTKVFDIDNYGVTLGEGFYDLSMETKFICLITGLFTYGCTQNAMDVTNAINYCDMEFDLNEIVSQSVLYHLTTKSTLTWHGEEYIIDILNSECDDVIRELENINNDVISSLLYSRNKVMQFGPTYAWKRLSELLEMKIDEITFFDNLYPIPNDASII